MKIKFTFFALLCPCDLIGFIFSLKSKTNYFWAAPMFIKRTDLKLHFHFPFKYVQQLFCMKKIFLQNKFIYVLKVSDILNVDGN